MPFRPDAVFFDGSSQFYRAFFQLQTLINSKGMPTGAIYGFSNIIRHILAEFRPSYVAIAWDSHRTIREEKFSEYKSHRKDMPDPLRIQIPYIKKIIDAYSIPNFEVEGFEADDVIATLVKKLKEIKPEIKILIVTSDKDIMQVVDKNVWVYDPRAEKEPDRFYNPRRVEEKFGVKPEQIPDFLALVGDQTDNIPGVRGIGPEGAKKLLRSFHSVEGIYKSLHMVDTRYRKALLGERERVMLYKDLAKLKIIPEFDVSLEKLKPSSPNIDALIEIFRELEFSSYLKDFAAKYPDKFKKLDESKFFLVDSDEMWDELEGKIKKERFFAFDTETTSLTTQEAKLVGISFAFRDGTAYYIHSWGREKEVLGKLKKYFEDEGIGKIGQNIKYDIEILKNYGVDVKGIDGDTMIEAWILNPDRTKIGLDELSLIYVGHKTTSYEDITLGKKIGFEKVSPERAKNYSCEDSAISLVLHEKLSPLLEEKGLFSAYKNIEIPLIPVLADMEMVGVKVDVEFFMRYAEELKAEIAKLASEIYKIAGVRFNIDSTQQLSAVLFDRMKIKLEEVKRTRKTKAYSTDVEVLQEIASKGYKIGELVLRYRTLKKLLSTYVMPLPKLINQRTGRLHTSFNQTKTATGRLSSSNPNLQNIPAKGEEGSRIREGFVAEEGNVLVSADYSQIELRVLAHLSGDENLRNAFFNDIDIHTEVASRIFGVPHSKVDREMRRIAKVVNFGIIYGISAHGLKYQARLPSRHDAQKLIDSYFEKYPAVREWREKVISQAEKDGFVRTITGRIRYIPELRSDDRNIRAEGERRAVNTPVQGSASDIMKVAMVRVWRRLKNEIPNAKIIMQVHDELIVECPENSADEVAKILEEEMKIGELFSLSVPLKIKTKIGRTWAELD